MINMVNVFLCLCLPVCISVFADVHRKSNKIAAVVIFILLI